MFDVAFIQENGGGRLMPESRLVRDHCHRVGLPVTLFTPKRLQRRQLALSPHALVFGDMDCMHSAMRQLRIPIPDPSSYPDALTRYLHRKVWRDTLGGVRARIEDGGRAIFVKPATRAKRFTGRVFAAPQDFYDTEGASDREPVWCADVVDWASEHRVYVNGGVIVAIDPYAGDEGAALDLDIVRQAVADFEASGAAPAAYGVDFGRLNTGETALVEANDGYGLGAYAIESTAYAELVFARWRQLLATAEP